MLRQVDAATLNLCEYAEVDMMLLNRVLALRAAAEGLFQSLDDPAGAAADPAAARARVLDELEALESMLHQARPSAMAVALGLGW
jgi:hypothetical protein